MSEIHNHTSFIGALSVKQRLQLSMEAPRRTCTRGAYLYLEGADCSGLFILQRGRIKLSRLQDSGREITISIIEEGDIFGLECLEGSEFREANAQAMEDCQIVAISHERMRNLLDDQPRLGMVLLRIMSEKLRDSRQVIQRLLLKDVKARLASLLLELAERSGIPEEDGIRLGGKITHQDLANLIGSTRETTTATLNQFKRHQLIDVRERQITISAWDGLAKLAS
ncbi:MAG: Crp/Fnr family transcriptional regulator [bacterium]|nr:Crp/Fnr family transcriptional regulator [bacterium]